MVDGEINSPADDLSAKGVVPPGYTLDVDPAALPRTLFSPEAVAVAESQHRPGGLPWPPHYGAPNLFRFAR